MLMRILKKCRVLIEQKNQKLIHYSTFSFSNFILWLLSIVGKWKIKFVLHKFTNNEFHAWRWSTYSLYYLMVRKKGGGGVGGGLDDLTSHHLVLGQSYSSYANETARFRTASAGSIAAGLNSLSTSATTATTAGHPVIQASCAKLD